MDDHQWKKILSYSDGECGSRNVVYQCTAPACGMVREVYYYADEPAPHPTRYFRLGQELPADQGERCRVERWGTPGL